MSRTSLCCIVMAAALIYGAGSAPGQEMEEPVATETAATEAEEQPVQEAFELDMPADGRVRDPFWPVDFSPEAPVTTQQTVQAETTATKSQIRVVMSTTDQRELIKKKIAIRGIMKKGDQLVAIINNQPVAQGETVTVQVEGVTYRYLIRTLTEDNVVLEPISDGAKPSSQVM